jgi:hypothetical protein
MLVYCWGPGQQCRIHDLSGAHCILAVLKGEALKLRFERGGGGQIRAVSYQPLPTGAVSAAAPDELHIIANWLDPQCGLVTLQVHLSPRAALQTEPAPGVGAVPFEHLRQLAAPHI